METRKEKKVFKSLSDSIVKLITLKHEEIEAEAKQLLDLEEEELERKNKELVERYTKLDSDKEKLSLCEKRYEERRRELEIYTVVIGEERDRVAEQLIELEFKDVQFILREEVIESRSRDNERRRKELDRILEKFKADGKKLEERNREIVQKEKRIEGSINGLDILSKDLERQRRELDSNRKNLDERMHEVDQKERQLDERFKVFESNQRRLDADWKKLDRGLEQLKLKENSADMKSKEIELKRNCKAIVMDGKNLQIFLNQSWQNHEKMGDEVSFLLKLSEDPAKLVLDALEGFFPPYLRKNGNGEEFNGHIVQRSCILLLEQLLKISHDIKKFKITPEVNNEARRLSCVWITKLKLDSKHSMEILGFLFVLAVYNVISVFSVDEIFNYVKIVAGFEQVPELCCLLGMTDKISGLIQELVERKQHLLAIRYAFNYNLVEKFPLDSLLKDHIESSKIESAAIIKSGNNSRMAQSRAKTRTIFNLRAAITCIEKYNISSEYSPVNLRQMIASLNKHDEVEQKEAVVYAPAASAVAEAPQLQHTNTGSSVPVDSVDTKYVLSTQVSTDPLPKRRKLLDEKCTSMDNAEPKKQVRDNEKDLGALLRQDLDFSLIRDKVVEILRSSSNPAGLVLDVMRSHFLPTCSSASEEIPIKCCISLLLELRGFTVEHCTCQEAKKLGVSWKLILREEKSCDPMKIACFLLFHDVYQLGITIKAAQIVPLINSLDSPKQLHEVFTQIGLPEFLPDMIKKWIGSNHRVQAIRFIQALHLTDRFPPVQLINDHLHSWNKLADERYKNKQNSSHSQTLQEINYRLEGISIALALVKDCNLESVYPIKQLEHSRNVLKSRKEVTQKASTVGSSENRSLKRRKCRKRARESSELLPVPRLPQPLPHLQGMIGFNHQLPPYLPPNQFNHQRQSVNYGDLPGLFQNQGYVR